MQRHSPNGLAYYTFDSLPVPHAISTRHGGISPAPFHSLNLSISTGDNPNNVTANIARLHSALALDESATVSASQAQADHIAIVNADNRGMRIQNVDALVTNTPALPLLLRYADCVPIFFYDPARRAIGVAHAGWRGTVAKIAAKTVQAMQNAFGTRVKDVCACIAPSIGPCCYKVGDDVITQVRAVFDRADELLVKRSGSTHLDLWQANAIQLRELGVERIEIAEICTADHTDDFYSWRKENKNTGRFGAIIALPS